MPIFKHELDTKKLVQGQSRIHVGSRIILDVVYMACHLTAPLSHETFQTELKFSSLALSSGYGLVIGTLKSSALLATCMQM